jgi:hypothetical protein
MAATDGRGNECSSLLKVGDFRNLLRSLRESLVHRKRYLTCGVAILQN